MATNSNTTTNTRTNTRSKAKAPQTKEVTKVNHLMEKKTGNVTIKAHIESIEVKGTFVLTQVGKEDITLNIEEMPAHILANHFGYGVLRHAPDNLKASSPRHFDNLAEYWELYKEGFLSPKAKQLAEKKAKEQGAVNGGERNREAFEAWLIGKGHDKVVDHCAAMSSAIFWALVDDEPKLNTLYVEFKKESDVKEKKAIEEEVAKAKKGLASLFG